MKGKDTEEEL